MSDKYAALKRKCEIAKTLWEGCMSASPGEVEAIVALLAEREADKARIADLTEFLMHVKKCLVKNGEYSPLSHEAIDTALGIRVDGITLETGE